MMEAILQEMRFPQSADIAQSICLVGRAMHHRKDDIISLLVEFQHELNVFDFVSGAKINRRG